MPMVSENKEPKCALHSWGANTKNHTQILKCGTCCIHLCVECDRILTYGTLLDVLWQMYHAWITYGTVRRIA